MAGVADAGEENVVTVSAGKATTRNAVEAGTRPEYNIATVIVFAIETATRPGSLALLTGDVCHARRGDGARTHGQRLPGDAMALLDEHGLATGDVDLFAVVAGPGSFTGLRVGMAVAQGFALARQRRVVAVPTLEAMAEGWRLGQGAALGTRHSALDRPTLIVSCLDGQRGDIFFGAWALAPNQPVELGGVVIAPSVGRPDDLARAIEPQLADHRVVIVGDGRRYESLLGSLDLSLEDLSMTLAEVAARTAVRRPESAIRPHALRPLYIRRPDAVLARERAAEHQ